MSDLFEMMRRSQEAQAVRLGIPVARQFSDEELAGSMAELESAERELFGMKREERLGQLSEVEQSALNELNAGTLIAFRAIVTTDDRLEVLNVLAPDSCAATMQIMEILFGDFEAVKPRAIKIKVEPIRLEAQRRAA